MNQRNIKFTLSIPDQQETQFEREYDSSRTIREIKDVIRKEFYIYPEIEFILAKRKLDNQTILSGIVYDPINITIKLSDKLVQSILQDDIQKNKQRSQEVWILVITNCQKYPLNDEFLNLKQNTISCYYNLDTKPMKFADLTNRQDLLNINFIDHRNYRQLLESQFLSSNHKADLNEVLPKILQINWRSIYKIVIIFTDSKQCKITQWIKELFTYGYKIIFITLSDLSYQWIKQQQSAYPVFEGYEFNYQNTQTQNKEVLKKLHQWLNNTLRATITPIKQTTRKIIDNNNDTFGLVESFVRINPNDCNYEDGETIEETMEYIIPKLEYKQMDEIVEDLKKLKIKFSSRGYKKVRYTKEAIGKGECKTVYGSIIDNEYFVIKRPKQSDGYTDLKQVEQEIKNHLLAREIFENFYYQFQKIGEKLPANFGDLFVLQNNKGLYFVGEKKYSGDEIKFNSNGGFVNDSLDFFNCIAQAFSVYSYIFSKKQFTVLDLQGFIMSDKSYVWFSDPAIVTFTNEFSITDLGVAYSDQYLAQWDAKKQMGSELLAKIGIY